MTAVEVAATSISSVTLEVLDPAAAGAFYTAAFGLGAQLGLRASDTPTTGFRGFTMSLVVSQSAMADGLDRRRPRRRRDSAQGRQEESLGLRRRRLCAGRDDLEGRDVVEERHRPGHSADR